MAFIPENNISDYLDGALKGEDLRVFNNALKKDASLREAVALQQQIEAELAAMGDDDEIAALIKNAETAHPYQHQARVRRFPRWLAVAAILALAAGAWFVIRPQRLAPPQLAARYAENNVPESVLFIPKSLIPTETRLKRDTDDSTNLLRNARDLTDSARIFLYTRKYPEALAAYRQIPKPLLNDSLAFQKSLLLLQLDDPAAALATMEEINLTFDGGIYWYKALAFLYLDDAEAARTQVQTLLEDENSSYFSEALLLKEEIDTYLTFPFSKRRLKPETNRGDY